MNTRSDSTRKAKDADVVLGNGIAAAMVAGAIALAVIGLLVGFDIISNENPLENGALWLGAGVIVGLCANVFRREHHVVDSEEYGTNTTTSYNR
jgi:hypothetical protein